MAAPRPFDNSRGVKTLWEATAGRGARRDARRMGRASRVHVPRSKRKEAPTPVFPRDAVETGLGDPHLKKDTSEAAPKVAPRAFAKRRSRSSTPMLPQTVGGSARSDPAPTTPLDRGLGVFLPRGPDGRYCLLRHPRANGMAAAMNGNWRSTGGVALIGGTFLVFFRLLPAVHAALGRSWGAPVVYVLTHDSIRASEQTARPTSTVEHLAMLRADAQPPLVAAPSRRWWRRLAKPGESPLQPHGRATLLASLPPGPAALRIRATSWKNLSAQGAYVLADATGPRRGGAVWATGSEVRRGPWPPAIFSRRRALARVSSPCPRWELFAGPTEAYSPGGSCPAGAAVARGRSRAGGPQPWDRWLTGERGREQKADFSSGMSSFGALRPRT